MCWDEGDPWSEQEAKVKNGPLKGGLPNTVQESSAVRTCSLGCMVQNSDTTCLQATQRPATSIWRAWVPKVYAHGATSSSYNDTPNETGEVKGLTCVAACMYTRFVQTTTNQPPPKYHVGEGFYICLHIHLDLSLSLSNCLSLCVQRYTSWTVANSPR